MNRFLIAAAAVVIAAAMTTFSTAAFAVGIGDFLGIGQPNYYGQLDIDGYPRPQLLYRYPRVIGHVPRNRPPIYLRVPPVHAKHWKKHCRQYNACNQRVLFVRNNWYTREYAPRYQAWQRKQKNDHGRKHPGKGGNHSGHGRKH